MLFRPLFVAIRDLKLFSIEITGYFSRQLRVHFLNFESRKGAFAVILYRQRGKMARRLMHSGMAGVATFSIMIAPIVAQEFPGAGIDPWEAPSPSAVLSASTETTTATLVSDKEYRDRIVEYTVVEGDTISTIAEKFGVSMDTIRWQNDLATKDSIKMGQTLEILPVTGVSHKVKKGDSVYSIAKRYDIDPQGIVNFPFNTFMNDETFELAIGQTVVVPEGVMPQVILWSPVARVKQITPDAGTVLSSGSCFWAILGSISFVNAK